MYIEIYKGLIINSIMNNYNCLNLNQYTQFALSSHFLFTKIREIRRLNCIIIS